MKYPIVLAITGASGAIYGQRLLEVLLTAQADVCLTISGSAQQVIKQELGLEIDLKDFSLGQILPGYASDGGRLRYYHFQDFMAPIASGSFRTESMVICPCSGSTLSGIAAASGQNLIQRAGEVHLKEKRPLILVTRETPLSLIQLENMQRACLAGATILPASPGFYHNSQTIADLVDFVVGRILDQLGIEHQLVRRWGSSPGVAED
jgi:4-hydroxy-3-polyprenylbenzoate decarboxylase